MIEEVELEEFIHNFVDFLRSSKKKSSSETEGATESATCHDLDLVIHPATKLEKLEKRYSKLVAVKDSLEMITKKQKEKIIALHKTIGKIKEDVSNAEDLNAHIESLLDDLQSKVAACKAGFQEQRLDDELNDQLDREGEALPVEPPSKRMKKE